MNDYQDMEQRAGQQVYMKKALRSLAKWYLESEWTIEANVKISKKKNGPENVFLNAKSTKKKIINVKVKSERGREGEIVCVWMYESKKGRDLLTERRSGKKLRAKEQSRKIGVQ